MTCLRWTGPARAALAPACMWVLGMVAASGAIAARAPSLHDAVQAAWTLAPDRYALDGQRGEAAARARAARAFFPGAPYATGEYFDDHLIGSNQGYTTYQGELATPLWLPGEGTATERSAQADLLHLSQQGEAMRLELARQVLEQATAGEFAADNRAVAARRVQAARQLQDIVSHAVGTGEAPGIDAEAAQAALGSAQIALSDAEAQLAGAQGSLVALTGSAELPDLTANPAVLAADRTLPGAEQLERDPRVASAHRELEAAEAALRLVRVADRDDPEVGIEGIHEKQFGSPWDNRVGVMLKIPFGSTARNLPRIAAATARLNTAEARLLQQRRLVAIGLQQALARLRAARANRSAAATVARELDGRAVEVVRAWHVGEMPLIEATRAQTAAFDADLAARRASTMLQAAQWQVALAEGVLP